MKLNLDSIPKISYQRKLYVVLKMLEIYHCIYISKLSTDFYNFIKEHPIYLTYVAAHFLGLLWSWSFQLSNRQISVGSKVFTTSIKIQAGHGSLSRILLFGKYFLQGSRFWKSNCLLLRINKKGWREQYQIWCSIQ